MKADVLPNSPAGARLDPTHLREEKLTKNDLFESYLKDAAIRGMSPGTLRTYGNNIKLFREFLDGRDPVQLTKNDVRDYIEALRIKGLTTKTIGHRLSTLYSFYEYLIFEELIDVNPVVSARKRYLSVYKADGEKHTHKVLAVEEAAKLVDSMVDIRDRALVVLLFKTGIRRSEICALDVDDIDWRDQSILLKNTKKRTNKRVFFDDEAAYLLRRWLSIREERNKKGGNALFVSSMGGRMSGSNVYTIIRNAATKIGLHNPKSKNMEDHVSPHCGRHCFTTWLMDAGMPDEYVAELRGDARRRSLDIYYHIDMKKVRESYLAHIPQLGV